MDEPALARQALAMGQVEQLTCPKCRKKSGLFPSGKGLRVLHCPDCDSLDPMKSDRAIGWIKGELQPPK